MIKTISSKLQNGDKLLIDLKDLDESGYTVVSIDGLGAPKATINSVAGSTYDGERFGSASIGKRTITLTLAINGAGDLEEERRNALYHWFPIKNKIVFGIVTSSKDVTIDPYVEAMDINMFSKVENAVISLVALDPMFKATESVDLIFYGTNPLFEFEFSNESLTEPMIIMGEINNLVQQSVTYSGDSETGVILTLYFIGNARMINISNLHTNESINIDTDIVESIIGSPIQLGDSIIINTKTGEKSVTLVRAGLPYNIMNSVEIYKSWLRLIPGPNEILYAAVVGTDNVRMSMAYDVLYTGV